MKNSPSKKVLSIQKLTRELIGNGEIGAALDDLEDYGEGKSTKFRNEIIHFKQRHQSLKKIKRSNLDYRESINVDEVKLTIDILEFIDQIGEKPFSGNRKHKFVNIFLHFMARAKITLGWILILISFSFFIFRFDILKRLFVENSYAPSQELVFPILLLISGSLLLFIKS